MRRKRKSYSLTVSDHLRLITLVLIIVGYLVTLTVSPLHAQLADSAWPMFKHDARHTGQSPYVGPETNTLKWQYGLPSGTNASPVIGSDGTIYNCNSGVVFAINRDGSLKWRCEVHPGGGPAGITQAISSDGTIYTPNGHSLYALNPDGTLKWEYHSNSPIASSPSIGADGIIYIECGVDLLAIKPDGNLFWKYRVGVDVGLSPAIGQDGTIYVRGEGDYLIALNPDGTEKWKFNLGSTYRHTPPVIGSDGTIYTFGLIEVMDDGNPNTTGFQSTGLYAINPNGSLKWVFGDIGFKDGAVKVTPAIGSDGTIYLAGYAISPSGVLQWTFELPDGDCFSSSSLAIDANGVIYFGTWGNHLYALNPNGTLKWVFETLGNIDSSPAIGPDGTIYFGSWDGYLYAIGPSVILDGDANGDGSINVQDVICIINVILDIGTASGNPDCNSDGDVNVQDVICVINKILGG